MFWNFRISQKACKYYEKNVLKYKVLLSDVAV